MGYNAGKTSLDLNLTGGVNIDKKSVSIYTAVATGTLYTCPASHTASVIMLYLHATGATGEGTMKINAIEMMHVGTGATGSSIMTFDYSCCPVLVAGETISVIESAGGITCTAIVVEEDV